MTFEEKDGNLIIGQMTEGQKADFEKFFNYYLYSATKAKNILPRPVIRDDNGKIIKDYSPCDFYLKLQEEIFEVMEVQADFDRDWNSRTYDDIAEEIVDVITVCISQLEALGYDENKRSKLFAKVNDKNEKRGYFKESD